MARQIEFNRLPPYSNETQQKANANRRSGSKIHGLLEEALLSLFCAESVVHARPPTAGMCYVWSRRETQCCAGQST